jgi:soluble lytic murein transglycosylase-like protein
MAKGAAAKTLQSLTMTAKYFGRRIMQVNHRDTFKIILGFAKKSLPLFMFLFLIQFHPYASAKQNAGNAAQAPSSSRSTKAELMYEQRVENAGELLGRYYSHSVVRTTESVDKINNRIYQWVRESLPRKYKKDYKVIAQSVIDEAYRNDFDPVLLMAVIQSESHFTPTQIGGVGEIGMMQIRPATGKWIAEKTGRAWHGKRTLLDPVENIRLGAAYLSLLREQFDSHARLYLAAYNMGSTNVRDALDRKIWPKDYPRQVMKNYIGYYTQLREQLRGLEKKSRLSTEKS